jgi:hypothetical protein
MPESIDIQFLAAQGRKGDKEAAELLERFTAYMKVNDDIPSNALPETKRDEAQSQDARELDALIRDIRAGLYHDAPSSCWSTGPLTGNPVEDYVVCPGCRGLKALDKLAARLSALAEKTVPWAMVLKIASEVSSSVLGSGHKVDLAAIVAAFDFKVE